MVCLVQAVLPLQRQRDHPFLLLLTYVFAMMDTMIMEHKPNNVQNAIRLATHAVAAVYV